jgi:hypothetical protein
MAHGVREYGSLGAGLRVTGGESDLGHEKRDDLIQGQHPGYL